MDAEEVHDRLREAAMAQIEEAGPKDW